MWTDPADRADEHGDVLMAHRHRSAPDDPDVVGQEHARATGDSDPRDSVPPLIGSALLVERAGAYRATVDAAYREYAIARGPARGEDPGRGIITPAMRRMEADDPEPQPAGPENHLKGTDRPAPAEQTGARGPASGREFNPESAGGPIQQLDAGKAVITSEGVQEVAAHLRRFTGGGPLDPPEQGMLDRLTSIAAGDIEPTSYDRNFFTHELDEASRYAKLGFGPDSGVDLGSPEMYEVWNDAHTAALEDYGVSGADLFYPGLAS